MKSEFPTYESVFKLAQQLAYIHIKENFINPYEEGKRYLLRTTFNRLMTTVPVIFDAIHVIFYALNPFICPWSEISEIIAEFSTFELLFCHMKESFTIIYNFLGDAR